MAKEIRIYTQDELSKVDKNILNPKQLDFILKPTPKIHTYSRPAKGGGTWTYVTGVFVKKTLNFLFGWNWDFEVINFEMNMEAKQCIVQGKLTCRTNGQTIIRNQFGRADIKFKSEPVLDANGKQIMYEYKGQMRKKMQPSVNPLDLGNDLKAATTDALKKCASELGLFSDIYAPNEYKEIKVVADDDADNKEFWRKKISDAINNCEDEGVAEAMRKDAIDLDNNSESSIQDYREIYARLTIMK